MKKNTSQLKTYKWFWYIYTSVLLSITIVFILISLGWLGFMPSFEELENPKTNLATEVYSDDGSLLGKYFIENRTNIQYKDLSPQLVNALIATEDSRFYSHSGIDFTAMGRVIFGVLTFSNKGGGSTITQQLAKNLFPRDPNPNFLKLVFTKLKEWVVAAKLERNYTKEEIIAMYFNTVDFGSLAVGIKSATKTFFDKEPKEINTQEAAVLIGLLKAPTTYSPIKNPENALNRRNVVLNQMCKYDFITKQQYDDLKKSPIDVSKYKIQDHTAGVATYFREFLRLELIKWCESKVKPDGTKYNLYKDGLRVYTTINYKMQKYAEEAVKEYIGDDLQNQFFKHWKGVKNAPFYSLTQKEIDETMLLAMKQTPRYASLKANGLDDARIKIAFMQRVKMRIFTWKGEKDTLMSPYDSIKYYKTILQCGLMALDPVNGNIKAYIGGINYKNFQFDHVMSARRQVGSTFKPFVYTLAMQEGEFSPCSLVPNVPVSFEMADGQPPWTPKNSGDARDGEMVTLKWALANSVNYISAYLIKKYSPQSVIKLCQKMGIKGEIPAVPSICLGTPELTLSEMVGAFGTFANQGVYTEPIFLLKICDNKGNVLETFTTKSQEAIDQQTAYLMVKLMQGVVEGGTASRLRYKYELKMPVAGKTGTTQNNSDGWFMGMTPQIVGGVWVGCEDRSVHFRNTTQGQGANTALPIWALFVKKCYKDKTLKFDEKIGFKLPKNPINVELDCNTIDPDNKNDNKNIFD